MTLTTFAWMSCLVAVVALWPEESLNTIAMVTAKAQLFYMNQKLRLMAWLMYRRLKKDFARMGIEIGPFVYVPLEERGK